MENVSIYMASSNEYGDVISNIFNTGIMTIDIKAVIIDTNVTIFNIFSLSASLSNENLKTASDKFSVIIGTNTVVKIVIKSTVPYSATDKTLVYNGTKKKLIILEPKFPIEKNIVFLSKYFFLDSFFT